MISEAFIILLSFVVIGAVVAAIIFAYMGKPGPDLAKSIKYQKFSLVATAIAVLLIAFWYAFIEISVYFVSDFFTGLIGLVIVIGFSFLVFIVGGIALSTLKKKEDEIQSLTNARIGLVSVLGLLMALTITVFFTEWYDETRPIKTEESIGSPSLLPKEPPVPIAPGVAPPPPSAPNTKPEIGPTAPPPPPPVK